MHGLLPGISSPNASRPQVRGGGTLDMQAARRIKSNGPGATQACSRSIVFHVLKALNSYWGGGGGWPTPTNRRGRPLSTCGENSFAWNVGQACGPRQPLHEGSALAHGASVWFALSQVLRSALTPGVFCLGRLSTPNGRRFWTSTRRFYRGHWLTWLPPLLISTELPGRRWHSLNLLILPMFVQQPQTHSSKAVTIQLPS